MRSVGTLACLFVLGLCELVVAQQGKPSQTKRPSPFSLSISGPSDVQSGSEIGIRVHVTNTSDHEIDMSAFYTNGVNLSFQYDVRDQSGGLVEKRNLPGGGSIRMRKLAVGEETDWSTLISRAVVMTLPGQYAIQLSRATGYPDDPAVQSNKITVNVTSASVK